MRHWLIGAMMALTAAGLSAEAPDSYAAARPFAESFAAQDPSPAPLTPLLSPGGEVGTLAAYRGAPTLVVLWATWCPVCREEMPALAARQALFEAAGVSLAAISVDAGDDAPEKVAAHMRRERLDVLPALVDKDHALASALGLRVLTTLVFLDADGRIVGRIEGRAPWDDPALLAFLRGLAADG